MANSILYPIGQADKSCFITGRINNLHKHHIFAGVGYRDISEREGLWVYLIAELHNQSNYGVHCKDGHSLDLVLKHLAQKAYMDLGHTKQQFIDLIGKSYLLTDAEFKKHMQAVMDNVRLL